MAPFLSPASSEEVSHRYSHNSEQLGKRRRSRLRQILQLWYDLCGVVIHCGPSAYGGHYIAHLRNESTGRWFRFDDDNVTQIEESQVTCIAVSG
jgi:ubiquitin C-terminal hydrolase